MTSSLLANSELDFNSMSSETEHEGRSLLLVRAEGKRRFEQARRARAAQFHFDADADARRYHQKNENFSVARVTFPFSCSWVVLHVSKFLESNSVQG